MSAPEIVAKGIREELKTKGKQIVKYIAAPYAAYKATTQAMEEYDRQTSKRSKKQD